MSPPVTLPPVTINPIHALRLSSAALDLAEGNSRTAVALLVHALAGTLAMALTKAGVAALIEDQGGDFSETLAEALPQMAAIVAEVEGRMLATMRPEGQA
jgi:CRISPR/Cas system-associated protein Csm6